MAVKAMPVAPEADRHEDYNLLGQKLGPKGRQVRERLREAARMLMASQPTTPPTLTAVTLAAGVKLTGVYRYYADVGALYVDAMRPLREEMAPLIALLDQPWQPGSEYREALAFAAAHFNYWRERRGALFLRNSLAERGDERFVALRIEWASPLYRALAAKLAAAHGRPAGEEDLAVAGVVLSGMERTVTLILQQEVADGETGDTASTHRGGAQQVAIARIITTFLRHDYLQA